MTPYDWLEILKWMAIVSVTTAIVGGILMGIKDTFYRNTDQNDD